MSEHTPTKLREYAEENTCPRCGAGDPHLNWLDADHQESTSYSVECEKCGLEYQKEYSHVFTGCMIDTNGNGELYLAPKPDPLEAVRAAAPNLLKACKLLRHRLWTRRTKFSDRDHDAMNAGGAAIDRAEPKP